MAEVLRFPAVVANRPPDWEQRERALDIRQSWIVEAPAGSGKTGLLIQRYLKLLGDETVTDPAQVLAITFTVKATSEMRERALLYLSQAKDGIEPKSAFDRDTRVLAEAVLSRDRQLDWNLLENPQRLRIQTITSVCAGIARDLPVLSGSGGGAIHVRGWELHRDAARRTLMLLGGEDRELNAAIETLMLHRDGNLANCEALLANMLGWREQWGKLVPLGRSDLDDAYLEGTVLPKIERALEVAVCRALTQARRAVPPATLDELAELAGDMAQTGGPDSLLAICREIRTAPGTAAEDLAHWRAMTHLLLTKSGTWRAEKGVRRDYLKLEDLLKHHATQLKDMLARLRGDDGALRALCGLSCLPPLRYPQEQWVVTKALFRVLSRALVELQMVFAEQGTQDFTEVGLLAEGALGNKAALDDLMAANGMRLQHLLVDEMQDTSTNQYELIRLLTEGWDGQSQTLFLVGDPKQSIYLFRQARVERFVQAMLAERVGDISVGCLRLTANFRSQRNLVESFNRDFSRLFPRKVDASRLKDVPYVEANAVRPAGEAAGEVWHAELLPYTDDAVARTAARRARTLANAREIRQIVERWQLKPLPSGRSAPWKIAVLVRARTHLLEIVATLQAPDANGIAIPTRAVEIDPLQERPEILDLMALTRALLHPADRVAWLALLRAPWCGLTLADLHLLTGADDPQWAKRSIPQTIVERAHEMSEDGCMRLERLWRVMEAAAAQRGRLPVSEWVERTWRSLGADRVADEEQMSNVHQFLRLLDEAEEPGGIVRLSRLQGWLQELYAKPRAYADDESPVDLMTIHKAKGLEWDVVIVPALERTGKNSHGRLLTWMELDHEDEVDEGEIAHGILAPIKSRGSANTELNEWMKSVETARDEAERKRLFYVACTRAREELHLFASPVSKKDGTASVPANTLLHSAWPAAEERFGGDSGVVPAMVTEEPEPFELALAASAEVAKPPMLWRIPDDAGKLHVEALPLPYGRPSRPQIGGVFERPEGTFAARAFGNAVHAFLDRMAGRIADGQDASELFGELPQWKARVEMVLRSEGLPQAEIERSAARVISALGNTLRDPHGLWVLGAHAEAASEQTLVSADAWSALRLDRTFLAGEEPLASGVTTRWIIDFKTSTFGREGLEAFLANERVQYAPQLNAYALRMGGDGVAVKVGLYYPLVPRLVWWEAEDSG